MTMITPSYLGETIEYSSLHACRSTLEDPTGLILSRERRYGVCGGGDRQQGEARDRRSNDALRRMDSCSHTYLLSHVNRLSVG